LAATGIQSRSGAAHCRWPPRNRHRARNREPHVRGDRARREKEMPLGRAGTGAVPSGRDQIFAATPASRRCGRGLRCGRNRRSLRSEGAEAAVPDLTCGWPLASSSSRVILGTSFLTVRVQNLSIPGKPFSEPSSISGLRTGTAALGRKGRTHGRRRPRGQEGGAVANPSGNGS